MKQIDYYFWINSDWALLGAQRLEYIAARHGARIAYKPVDLIDVYRRTGGIPLPQRSPQRRAYREAELRRWMRRLAMPLNITPRHMCPDGEMASRYVIAADMLGHAVAPLYTAILRAEWCEERDISDPEVIQSVAAGLGLPAQRLSEAAAASDTGDRYRRYTDEAVAAGVFGSPGYVLDGEVFWGQDRLEFLDEALAARAD